MVRIESSKCECGRCSKTFYKEWEFEMTSVSEEPMGECVWYKGSGESECPVCGNVLYGSFSATEYPAGTLETISAIDASDSKKTGRSKIDKPRIRFFDL